MPNRWIQHVKQFAKANGLKYGEALNHADVKKGYTPAPSPAVPGSAPVMARPMGMRPMRPVRSMSVKRKRSVSRRPSKASRGRSSGKARSRGRSRGRKGRVSRRR